MFGIGWVVAIDHPLPTDNRFDNLFVDSRLLLTTSKWQVGSATNEQRRDLVCLEPSLKHILNIMIIIL